MAVVGSVFSSVYAGALADGPVFAQLSTETQAVTEESVGAAQVVGGDLGATAPAYLAEVSDAFMSGFGVASLVVALVAGAGAVFAAKFLPAQAADTDAEVRESPASPTRDPGTGQLDPTESRHPETVHCR